jgi:hypothetical protein
LAALRQPTELSGVFKPVFVLPIRGDWLVELRGFEPETLSAQLRNRKSMATAFRAELTLGVLPYSSPLSGSLSEKIDQDVMNPAF